jgi:hypothetical protein
MMHGTLSFYARTSAAQFISDLESSLAVLALVPQAANYSSEKPLSVLLDRA